MALLNIIWILFLQSKSVTATEVTATASPIIDDSLGIRISLPLLTCHPKHRDYHQVLWYKDYKLIKNGSADFSDHMLSLADLGPPLKLQGYYWCETDVTSVVHKYLFMIKEVNTYVGRLLMTNASLEGNTTEELEQKMGQYEKELENVLFEFLPTPNTQVTGIRVHQKGLELIFYVYDRGVLHQRKFYPHELIRDEQQLEYIMDYIYNETEIVDDPHYKEIVVWAENRGVDIKTILLNSTLGCYSEKTLISADPPKVITWPRAYFGEVVIPEESCSTKDGLAVTRECTGDFYTGARWSNPSGNCDSTPRTLTKKIMQHYDNFGEEPKPIYIQKLVELSREASHFGIADLHLTLSILTQISLSPGLQLQDLTGLLSIINALDEANINVLVAAKNTIHLTSRLLQIMDNILKNEAQAELSISKKNLLVDVKSTKQLPSIVVGIAISSSGQEETLENTSAEFLVNGTKKPKQDSLAYFLLPLDLIEEREIELNLPSRMNLVFFRDLTFFPNPKSVLVKRNYNVLSSSVMHVSLSGGPAFNLVTPAELFFKNMYAVEIEHPVCVYFDPLMDEGRGAWNTEGCEYVGLEEGFYHCRCYHLSIFAVILSVSPETSSVVYDLGTAVYVGCSISIIALGMAVVLYMMSKKWRMTVDQSILFHLCFSFLCCIILIFVSEVKFRWNYSCFTLSLMVNFFLVLTFSWLLVHAVVHKLRFTMKTDMAEVPHFTLKTVVCTWGASIAIMLIVWITRDYKYYNMNSCWGALTDTARATLIPVSVLSLVILCINLCAVYAVTCRFQKDYLLEDSTYHESVIKFRIAFTIFFFLVLCWLFGFFALQYGHSELRVLFSISIIVTSYYLALFFIFQETTLWEMLQKYTKKSQSSEETVIFTAKPSP